MDLNLELSTDVENYEDYENFISEEDIESYVKNVLETEYASDKTVYVSILLTSDDAIRLINKEYRGKDAATDVISFAYHETDDFEVGPFDTLGEIIISLERVAAQAREYNHSPKRELYYVLTHGLLHLLGYDHLAEEDKNRMRQKEEELLTRIGCTRD